MKSLVFPHGIRGINDFSTASWWAERAAELAAAGVERDVVADGVILTWPDGVSVPWDGPRRLLLTGAVTGWLPVAGVDEMIGALSAWADAVVAAAGANAAGTKSTTLAVQLGPVESLQQLVTLAGGRRWPVLDPTAGAAAEPSEPATLRGRCVRRLDEALAGSLAASPSAPGARGWDRSDAVASVERALRVVEGLSTDEAAKVREATIAVLDRVDASVRIVGPRDALLWPVPTPDDGTLPTDVVVRAAMEVLAATTERAVAPAEVAPAHRAPARRLPGRLQDRLRGRAQGRLTRLLRSRR